MSALGPRDVASLLGAAVRAIEAEVTGLPEPLLAFHPAPGEWCVKEVLGHLIETEQRGFAGRIRIILGAQDPRLEGWDQAEVARARRDCVRDARELVRELASLREASMTLAAGLKDADLGRGGHHPKVGYLTVNDLLHEWVHHDRNHMKQMLANVQSAAWPHMGAAQRFSSG